MTEVRSGTALVTVGGGIPIDPADGAAHLFVDPVNGSDANIGLEPSTAFQTIGKAVDRMNEWLALGIDADLVIELANGTYNEDVKLIMQNIPVSRVFLRGDASAMTVLASGTLTAATAQLVTDAGAAFGALNQYAGRMIEVFDPANESTTRQFKTIRNHTGTAVSPVGPFSPVPVAGWTYRIVTPGAVIAGQGSGAFQQNPALRIVLPWTTSYLGSEQFPGSGPILGLMFIGVTSVIFDFGIVQVGGYVQYTGIYIEGAGDALIVMQGTAALYGAFPGVPDPIYLSTLTYSPNVDACLGTRVTGGNGNRVDLEGQMFGSIVSFGSPIFLQGGVATFFGGAIHGSIFDCTEQSELQIFGGSVNAADPLLPFLIRGNPGFGLVIREGTHAEIIDLAFEAGVAVTSNGFSVLSLGFLRLLATITAGVGDIAGIGVWCQDGGKAQIGSAVTFTTGGSNLRVGNGVDADGDSTFAALTLTAPLIDHPNDNGRGAMGVEPGSLASIWEI